MADIQWSNLHSSVHSSSLLCDTVFQHNLTQLIMEPTHIKGNILDLLITNIDNHINDLMVNPICALVCFLTILRLHFMLPP